MNILKINIILAFVLVGFGLEANAQNSGPLKGRVLAETEGGDYSPMGGARVYWSGGAPGAYTDPEGQFELPLPEDFDGHGNVVFMMVGFERDTVHIMPEDLGNPLEHKLRLNEYNAVEMEVVEETNATMISTIGAEKIENVTQKEFEKAACCNLSESFETTASVDVSYTDAVTGMKEVQMLGLAGKYTQITMGNQPTIRALGRPMGMNYIPGQWVESVQVSKGTGSVVNGYEALAGQINIELPFPDRMDRAYANIYLNDLGRNEVNLIARSDLSESWTTGTFVHTSGLGEEIDRNDDGFLDRPRSRAFNGASVWRYRKPGENWEGIYGVHAVHDQMTAGQTGYDRQTDAGSSQIWGLATDMTHVLGFGKMGYIFPEKENTSIGFQAAGVWHDQQSWFGDRPYMGVERQLHLNAIYASQIGSDAHTFKAGASYLVDDVSESFDGTRNQRLESVPGVFYEHAWKPNNQLTAVGGLRADFHNLFGAFITPRLNVNYKFTTDNALRVSAGRGYRTPNVFIENPNIMMSGRRVEQLDGIRPEIGWNYGINFTQKARFWQREFVFTADAYHTRFENQMVIDLDADPRAARIYNLDGRSRANAAQVEVKYEVVKDLDVKAAYKWYDVQLTMADQLLERPLTPRHRALFNAEYDLGPVTLDYTLLFHGTQRLPRSAGNPEIYRRPERSPEHIIMNANITYKAGKVAFYGGGENLTNFTQSDPIVAADEPFSQYFDTSYAWGPILGRVWYVGVRYRLK